MVAANEPMCTEKRPLWRLREHKLVIENTLHGGLVAVQGADGRSPDYVYISSRLCRKHLGWRGPTRHSQEG